MADQPEISVLIPWCDRKEISRTLAANAQAFQSSGAEVLVINCGGDAQRLQMLVLGSEVPGIRQLNVEAPRFNKCLALNAGLLQSRAGIVFVLDSDVIVLDETLLELRAAIERPAFATVEWVYESEPEAPRRDLVGEFTATLVTRTEIEFVFRDGRRFHHQINRQDPFNKARAGRGQLMARKEDLLKIEGYNSELHTWGWEDDDMLVRLQYALGLERAERGRALHLSHGDDRRVLDKPRTESGQFNYIKCCRNYNRGIFTGTLAQDAPNIQASVPELVVGSYEETFADDSQDGPEDCGAEGGIAPGIIDRRNIPGLADLLLAAELRKHRSPVIVDARLASYACCRRHLTAALENYARQLEPQGALLTLERGIVSRPGSPCWEPGWDDVAATADRCGLTAKRSGYGVCVIKRKSGQNSAS